MTESYLDRHLSYHWSNAHEGWIAMIDGALLRSKTGVICSCSTQTEIRKAARKWVRSMRKRQPTEVPPPERLLDGRLND